MRISDWSSDVCSSDLQIEKGRSLYVDNCSGCHATSLTGAAHNPALSGADFLSHWRGKTSDDLASYIATNMPPGQPGLLTRKEYGALAAYILSSNGQKAPGRIAIRSEEPTSELQSLMRNTYAVFCLKK